MEMKLKPHGIYPTYGSPGAAAVDLYAPNFFEPEKCGEDYAKVSITIQPGDTYKVHTGVCVDIGTIWPNFGVDAPSARVTVGLICLPRSGSGSKGLHLANVIGLIDPDYQGEIILNVKNNGTEPMTIQAGERICQGMFVQGYCPSFELVDEFSRVTQRGEGGFGSTGVK